MTTCRLGPYAAKKTRDGSEQEGTTKNQAGRSISGWIKSVKRMQVPLILRFPTDGRVPSTSPQSISPRESLPTLQGKD